MGTAGNIRQGYSGTMSTAQDLLTLKQHVIAQICGSTTATDTTYREEIEDLRDSLLSVFYTANRFDEKIYEKILGTRDLDDPLFNKPLPPWSRISHGLECYIDTSHSKYDPESYGAMSSFDTVMMLFRSSATTLTSLNLDEVLTQRLKTNHRMQEDLHAVYVEFFNLRFPNLLAFQVRCSILYETELSDGFYLLSPVSSDWTPGVSPTLSIDFMAAHPRLRCLAWPMDRFYAPLTTEMPDAAEKSEAVVDRLSRSLTELRVDAQEISIHSEDRTAVTAEPYENGTVSLSDCWHTADIITEARDSRHRFIAEFLARMRNVEILKMEDGIPRDEKREAIRALGRCPLTKVVLIGDKYPLGNTWEPEGSRPSLSMVGHLEEEEEVDAEQIHYITQQRNSGLTEDFQAVYGWPPGPPLLHTIAHYHASTVTELKFTGFQGAPILQAPPKPITNALLSPLQHFHELRTLIISFWLLTDFEGSPRDQQIIEYWLGPRDPNTTALVPYAGRDDAMNASFSATSDRDTLARFAAQKAAKESRWARALKNEWDPARLAQRVMDSVGPFVSERTKARKGGLLVRANWRMGTRHNDLFDLQVSIGKASNGADMLVNYTGPRTEMDADRRKEKLANRRWF
ncbi:hypothetical protein LTR66_001673 [Elasticomyces elasticus]|nr:hypothetical protein LTR66_001673 [Elasticomyces elasticus]